MQVQGSGAGCSSTALPLAQGSSGRTDKAGHAQGAHQLVQLCLLKWQKVS